MPKIVVLASCNMDLVMRVERAPGAGETLQGEFAVFLGGKGFNQAVAARRLGAEVAVIGRVGDDEFGRQFLEAFDREEIGRRSIVVDKLAGTGVAMVLVEPAGENRIVQAPRANRLLTAEDIECHADAIAGADVALGQLETSSAAILAFMRAARAAHVRTILNPAPAAAVPAELLAPIELVPNEVEAETLTGMRVDDIDGAVQAASLLRERGPLQVVVTLGERGAVAVEDGREMSSAAIKVPVVDTVGAGDAFCAAVAVRLAEGAPLSGALRFANAAGALATTRAGAEPSMPHRAEVERVLKEHEPSG